MATKWLEVHRGMLAAKASGAYTDDDRDPMTAPTPQEPAGAPEVIRVPYQRIFFDWDVADGSYTPEQLRQSKKVVKPWGGVQTYPYQISKDGQREETREGT